jgi:plasmid maintenance system antidote protein VapI
MPKKVTIDDYKSDSTPHSKLLYTVAKKNNLTIEDLARDLNFSKNYIRCILKGTHLLSPDKAFIIRKKYEKEIT